MANNTIGSMTAVVRATAGQFGADIKQIQGHVNSLKQTVNASQPAGGLFDSFKGLGGIAAGLIGVGSAAAAAALSMRSLVTSSRDFSRAMAESTSIMTGVTSELREGLEQTARKVAFATKFSAAEAAKAYFFLASAGLDAKQAIGAMPVVATFAQAGMFDLAVATDMLADAQSALGMSSKDAAQNMQNMRRVADVLVKGNNIANASVEQLSLSLTTKAAGSMRLVNMEVEEGVAVLAALAAQGVKGEEAGTQFSIMLRDLQTKAIENAEAFKKAGIEVFDASGKFGEMATIVGQLEDKLEPLSDMARKKFLLDLGFSDKSMGTLQQLIGTSDKIREYHTELKNAGGVMDQVARDNIPALDSAMNKLSAAWDNLGSKTVAPVIERFSQVLVKAFDDIAKGNNTLEAAVVKIAAFAAAYGATALIFPVIVKGIGAIVSALRALAAGQSLVTALSGPLGWATLLASLAAGAAAVALVDKAFDGLAEAGEAAGKAAKEASKQAANVSKNVKADVLAANADEAAKKLEDLMTKGKAIAKEFRTPMEEFNDTIADLSSLLDVGAIKWQTYERAVAAATKKLDDSAEKKKKNDRFEQTPGIGAAVRGTSEGFSAVQSASRLQTDIQKRQEELLREELAESRRQTELQAQIAKSLETKKSTVKAVDI